MADIARDVTVTGRVQGVGYRAWTCAEARGLGLSGWVMNRPDGSVRARLAGPADAVAEMLSRMARGPSLSRVDRVEATDAPPPSGAGFEVRR